MEKFVLLSALSDWIVEARRDLLDLGVLATIGIIILPVVLAVVSRSIHTILSCLWLSMASLALLGQEGSTAATVALAALGGSLLVALNGIARRRRLQRAKEGSDLAERVSHLEYVQQREMLGQINPSPHLQVPDILPAPDSASPRKPKRRTKTKTALMENSDAPGSPSGSPDS